LNRYAHWFDDRFGSDYLAGVDVDHAVVVSASGAEEEEMVWRAFLGDKGFENGDYSSPASQSSDSGHEGVCCVHSSQQLGL
jgi:hypothetical protein